MDYDVSELLSSGCVFYHYPRGAWWIYLFDDLCTIDCFYSSMNNWITHGIHHSRFAVSVIHWAFSVFDIPSRCLDCLHSIVFLSSIHTPLTLYTKDYVQDNDHI